LCPESRRINHIITPKLSGVAKKRLRAAGAGILNYCCSRSRSGSRSCSSSSFSSFFLIFFFFFLLLLLLLLVVVVGGGGGMKKWDGLPPPKLKKRQCLVEASLATPYLDLFRMVYDSPKLTVNPK
jgi:hypothetical protein